MSPDRSVTIASPMASEWSLVALMPNAINSGSSSMARQMAR